MGKSNYNPPSHTGDFVRNKSPMMQTGYHGHKEPGLHPKKGDSAPKTPRTSTSAFTPTNRQYPQRGKL